MDDPAAEMRRVWRGLAGACCDAVLDDLLERHAEAHRHYHTATHVMWVLRHVDDLVANDAAGRLLTAQERDDVRAAALFHDAVYDPRSSSNERDSASLATAQLTGIGWSPARCLRVADLIDATAGHAPRSTVEAVLLDADLAILGAIADEYRVYVAAVREEYAHVDASAWRTGRAQVLKGFLGRPRLYATARMFELRELRARDNLAAELGVLEHAGRAGSGA